MFEFIHHHHSKGLLSLLFTLYSLSLANVASKKKKKKKKKTKKKKNHHHVRAASRLGPKVAHTARVRAIWEAAAKKNFVQRAWGIIFLCCAPESCWRGCDGRHG